MHRLVLPVVCLAATCASLPGQILLRSGQGLPGGMDPNVRFLQGPPAGGFGAPFTANDFMLANSGPNALVRPAIAGGWPYPMPGDPTARWIDTSPQGSTALYAIPFSVSQPFATARLRIEFAADDSLGTATEEGIYVNGQPVPHTFEVGVYYAVRVLETLDIGPLLQNGPNHLYLYQVNTGGAGGLIFSASIDFQANAAAPFGDGCGGSAGTPLFALGSGRPRLGETMVLTVHNLPQVMGPFFVLFGFDNRSWNGQPLPVDLTPFGMQGCRAWVAPLAVAGGANLGGGSLVSVPVPQSGVPLGLEFYSQCLVPDGAAPNTAGLTVSNALGFMIGL